MDDERSFQYMLRMRIAGEGFVEAINLIGWDAACRELDYAKIQMWDHRNPQKHLKFIF